MVPFPLQCFASTVLTCSETRLYDPTLAFYPVKQLIISTVDSLLFYGYWECSCGSALNSEHLYCLPSSVEEDTSGKG